MHIYTSSFFKFRNKANFYSFLGASAGTGAPRNTQKIGTQCGPGASTGTKIMRVLDH